MARIPASVTNMICRLAERAEGGAARSRPPVIDLANNLLRFNFILPMRLNGHCSKFPASAGLHLRHGYRRALTGLLPKKGCPPQGDRLVIVEYWTSKKWSLRSVRCSAAAEKAAPAGASGGTGRTAR